MAERGYFEHATPEGVRPADRALRAGYRYRHIGENLFQSTRYESLTYTRRDDPSTYRYAWYTPEALAARTVEAWLESPGHRANLLAAHFTHGGVGVAARGLEVLVTMNYSRPAPP